VVVWALLAAAAGVILCRENSFHVVSQTTSMRLLLFLAWCLLGTRGCLANEIDQLQSLGEVTDFLQKYDRRFQEEMLFKPGTADTLGYGQSRFFKLDLDGNGLTDLVVDGKYLLAVTAASNRTYRLHFIDRRNSGSARYAQLHRLVYVGTTPLLVVKTGREHFDLSSNRVSSEARVDSLVFKFGGFIEYQAASAQLPIARLTFSALGCFGTCPVFELTIRADRRATCHAIRYNSNLRGHFRGIIDTAAYNPLLATLQYLQLSALKDAYAVDWTDDQTVKLEVTFTNGQVKRLEDYGGVGTYGLANLYAQLFALRETQTWD
jgi:hypothetical protein